MKVALCGLGLFVTGEAKAISTGCAAFQATKTFTSDNIALRGFSTGDVVRFETTAGDLTAILFDNGGLMGNTTVLTESNANRSLDYTFTQAGDYELSLLILSAAASIKVTCLFSGDDSDETSIFTEAAAIAATTTTLRQTTGLVNERIRAVMPSTLRGGAANQTGGLAMISTDRPTAKGGEAAGRGGAAGGESGLPLAAWANFSWSAVDRKDRTAPIDQDAFTGVVGLDALLKDRILAGAALSVSFVKTSA